MNVRDADEGSSAKALTASCAATKAESILMELSSLKSANEMDKGSSAGVKWTAAAESQRTAKMTGSRDLPLYTTTLGTPKTDLTFANALTTASVFDKSVGMCSSSEVLSASFVDREAKATL